MKIAANTVPKLLKTFESKLGRSVKSVLEIGCGSAFMGPAFLEAGCSYLGTEIDKSLIKFAREKELEIVELQAEELDYNSLSDKKFDLILSSNVFEHLQSPRVAFSRLEGISSGLIVILVPNAEGLYQRLRSNTLVRKLIHLFVEKKQERAFTIDGCWHNIAYTLKSLEYLCNQSNLEIVESKTMSINDPVFGFVQPNLSLKYRAAAKLASLLNMESVLLVMAKPIER